MKVCRRGICSLIFDDAHTFQCWEGAGVLTVGNIDVGSYSSFVSCFQAVEQEHRDCAAILLEHGANHNLRGASGNTALHFAVMVCNKSLVELLLYTVQLLMLRIEQVGTSGKAAFPMLTCSTSLLF